MSEVAQIIASQIGGTAFAMMGAKQITACVFKVGEESLSWKVGRNAHSITHITVTLEPSDTYKVVFTRCGPKIGRTVVAEHTGIYVESLHGLIESETGFYLSL